MILNSVKIFLIVLVLGTIIYAQNYQPPALSAPLLQNLDFGKAKNIDKNYQANFDNCDKPGGRCATDPNKLKTLLRFGDDAIFFDSKMSLDLDGSWVGCNCGNNMGLVDQCSTSYYWNKYPADYGKTLKKDRCKFYENQDFVDSNKIPYIVIPLQFQNYFKINNKPYNFIDNKNGADFGIVVYKDKIIPVLVADQGPAYRIGEGSAALFREIGEDRCRQYNGDQCVKYANYSVGKNVLFLVFPNSRLSKDKINKDNALELIKQEALKRFEAFKVTYKK